MIWVWWASNSLASGGCSNTGLWIHAEAKNLTTRSMGSLYHEYSSQQTSQGPAPT